MEVVSWLVIGLATYEASSFFLFSSQKVTREETHLTAIQGRHNQADILHTSLLLHSTHNKRAHSLIHFIRYVDLL